MTRWLVLFLLFGSQAFAVKAMSLKLQVLVLRHPEIVGAKHYDDQEDQAVEGVQIEDILP